MRMPPITPYGVPIRDVIDSGDKDLMRAMITVSDFFARQTGGKKDGDWDAAHQDLEKASK